MLVLLWKGSFLKIYLTEDLQKYWPTDQELPHESKLSSFSYFRRSNRNVGLQCSSTQRLCWLFLSGAASYFMRECRNETRKQVFLFKKISALFLKRSKLLMWISELGKLSFENWGEDYQFFKEQLVQPQTTLMSPSKYGVLAAKRCRCSKKQMLANKCWQQ